MAGDWIKMRGNLWDDPRIGAICDATDQGEAAIIGGLYWLWAAADQHTEDGLMPGLSLRQVDRKTGIPGFAQALCDIGWIEETAEGLRIVKFEEHNGASAKRRCSEAQRKANSRNVSASDADKARTDDGQIPPSCGAREREEKEKNSSSLRSEENSRAPKAFTDEFETAWSEYPTRPGNSKADAFKAWNARLKAGATPAQLTDGVRRYARFVAATQTEAKFVKQAATFFGPGEHYLADWTPPARASPAGETVYQRQQRERYEEMTGKRPDTSDPNTIDMPLSLQ